MPRVGAVASTDCLKCKPGFECRVTGTVTPTSCTAGFYCLEGTDTTVNQCSSGKYCPTTAEMEFPCAYGSYTNAVGQIVCITAQAGKYIDTPGAIAEITCPVGFYCEAGSVTPTPCPSGQSSVAGATSMAGCTDVTKGLYRQNPT